jgi:hypothetical protein
MVDDPAVVPHRARTRSGARAELDGDMTAGPLIQTMFGV